MPAGGTCCAGGAGRSLAPRWSSVPTVCSRVPPKGWRGGRPGCPPAALPRHHPAQGRVEGQGVRDPRRVCVVVVPPPRPGRACLTHPWVLIPGGRRGRRDIVSLQLVCTVLQLWDL